MKNIINNIAIIVFAITVPTAASLAVMGAIVSGISQNSIQQSEIK